MGSVSRMTGGLRTDSVSWRSCATSLAWPPRGRGATPRVGCRPRRVSPRPTIRVAAVTLARPPGQTEARLQILSGIVLGLARPQLLATVVMTARPSLAAQAGAAQMEFLILFVVVHTWLGYFARGVAAFVVIASVVAFTLEAIGVATGFPFGSYTHHLPGPKPLGVRASTRSGTPT